MCSQSKPLISIVCATYNRADLLPRAIQSVLDQKFNRWELIVVDDGSFDSTENVVNNYANRDQRIKYLKLEENKGVGYARNRGVEKCRSEWVVLLDSDNSLTSDALFNMYEASRSLPGISLHKFQVRSFSGRMMCDNFSDARVIEGIQYLCNYYKGEFHSFTRRTLLLRYRFFEEFNGGEGIVWSKLSLMCKEIAYHPFVTELYDTEGVDRLSLRKKNYSRLATVYAKDICVLWIEYIRHCPLQLLKNTLKFFIYSALCRVR